MRRLLSNWQVCSDLHLVKNGVPRIKPSAPNLIIAGDLGCIGWNQACEDYIKSISTQFDRILFVPGNHDLFHESGIMQRSREDMLSSESKISNFTLLGSDRSPLNIDGCAVFGTTLWTHIPESYWSRYSANYIDFQRVKMITPDNPFTPNTHNLMHMRERQYIEKTLSELNKSLLPIIVTHHSPLVEGTCNHQYYKNGRAYMLNHAYCTDLHSMLANMAHRNPVFVFGHTHYRTHFRFVPNSEKQENGVYLVTNALGLNPYKPKNKGPIVPTKILDSLLD